MRKVITVFSKDTNGFNKTFPPFITTDVQERAKKWFASRIPPNTPSIEVEFEKDQSQEVSQIVEEGLDTKNPTVLTCVDDVSQVIEQPTRKRLREDDRQESERDPPKEESQIVEGGQYHYVVDVSVEPPTKIIVCEDDQQEDHDSQAESSTEGTVDRIHENDKWLMVLDSVRKQHAEEKIKWQSAAASHEKRLIEDRSKVETLIAVNDNLKQMIRELKESHESEKKMWQLTEASHEEELLENKTTIETLSAEIRDLKNSLQKIKDTYEHVNKKEKEKCQLIKDTYEKDKKRWESQEAFYEERLLKLIRS